MRYIMAALLLLITAPIHSQETARERKIDFALLVMQAGAHGLDIYSTRQMLNSGGAEDFLPDAIAHSMTRMAIYSFGTMGLEDYGAIILRRHGHRKLARWVPIIDTACTLPFAIHNLSIHARPTNTLTISPIRLETR